MSQRTPSTYLCAENLGQNGVPMWEAWTLKHEVWNVC